MRINQYQSISSNCVLSPSFSHLISSYPTQIITRRVLLAKSDARYASPEKSQPGAPPPSTIEESSAVVAELRKKLSDSEVELEKVTEQLSRVREYEDTLSKNLDGAREEASKFRLEAKRSQSDSDYNRQRFERLTKSFESLQKDFNSASSEKMKFQANIVAHQKRANELDSSLSKVQREKAVMAAELSSVKVSRDVAVSAESRFKEMVESMRKELASKDALIASVKRIEAGLSSQNTEGKRRLEEECQRLNKALADERQRSGEERVLAGRKLTVIEDNLKSSEKAKSDAILQASQCREKLAAALVELKAFADFKNSEDRTAAGSSLPSASAPLSASDAGAGGRELAKAKRDLLEAKKHSDNYKRLATATDKELKLTVAALDQLKKSEQAAQKNLTSKVEALDALGKDLMNQRQNQAVGEKKLKEEIASLQSQLANTHASSSSSTDKVAEMSREMESHMVAAKSAQESYERELGG